MQYNERDEFTIKYGHYKLQPLNVGQLSYWRLCYIPFLVNYKTVFRCFGEQKKEKKEQTPCK